MKQRTFCPYCGTANLVDKQLCYSENGIATIQCHLCKRVFTDLSIRTESEQIEDLQTT